MSAQAGPQMRWWSYLGPWPMRPVLSAAIVFVITAQIFSGVIVNSSSTSLLQSAAMTVVPSLASAATVGAVLWLGKRYLRASLTTSLAGYLAWLLLAATLALLVRFAVTHLPGLDAADAAERLVPAILRFWIWIVATQAVAGALLARLADKAQVAEDALALARKQESILLESEERSRRQVSQLLHDRVQAGVIAAALELRLIDGADPKADLRTRDSVVARLEALRDIDLRLAARSLSPDLWNVDLRAALTDLARGYEPTVSTRIDAPANLIIGGPLTETLLLASYRIAEQGLMNAAVHGEATSVRIAIRLDDSAVELTVADNGRGLPGGTISPGLGSAVVDAWCRMTGGTWRLDGRSASAAATLHARLPL